MNIVGKVHEVGPVQHVSETFKKRDLIVEYAENPTYPEYIKVEAMQDKTALFDNLQPGDQIDVSFNLRGRPWTDKTGKTSYFNTLVVWRISKSGESAQSTPAPQYAPPAPVAAPDGSDDLPF
ncbi:DUF3127 domain-containing protein [Pedobacter faecalis]|uniref:DUF3127 domain-containing protein n=1 Tax=Pedobacter faecalis TaxID=3041495 RepID=UPI00254F5558|nr:DUF3127 domain-containing protein [Pedobacter sp. ELA7]